jgi:hypothetical protein
MLRFKARLALAFPIVLSTLLCAQPPLTTVQDILYKADGTRFNGILTIAWNSFNASNNSNIATQSVTATVTNGYLRVMLVPTTNAVSPAVYNVVYNSDGAIQFTETWVVPPSTSPLSVSAVRSSSSLTGAVALSQFQISDVSGLRTELNLRPTLGAAFAVSRAAVIDASGGIAGATGNLSDCIHVDGTSSACGTSAAQSGFVDAQTPSGIVDGSNLTFQLASAPSPSTSLAFYRNGLALQEGIDFTLSGNAISFVTGNAPQPGDVLQAFYRIAASGTSGSGTSGSSSTPSCTLYTLANNGTNWTTAANSAPPTTGPAIASSTTQDVPLFGLPPRGTITGIREKTTTAWSGTGFSILNLSVGDSVGGPSFYTAPSYNLTAAVTNTNFRTTPLFLSATDTGSSVTAHITANAALNSAPINGAAAIDVCWVTLP